MAVDARHAAWWARAMPPGVRPVGGVLGVRPDGGWSTAAPRGSAGRVVWLLNGRPNLGRARTYVGRGLVLVYRKCKTPELQFGDATR